MSDILDPRTLEPVSIDSNKVEFDPPICSLCLRRQQHSERFGMFVIAIVRGQDPATNEPLVRDGIFDEHGKLAKLLSCPQCLPKLTKFRFHQSEADAPKYLPDGPIKKLVNQIWKRQKHPTVVLH